MIFKKAWNLSKTRDLIKFLYRLERLGYGYTKTRKDLSYEYF